MRKVLTISVSVVLVLAVVGMLGMAFAGRTGYPVPRDCP